MVDSDFHGGDENWIAHLGSPGPLSPRAGIVPPTPLYNFGEEVCFSFFHSLEPRVLIVFMRSP